jgi:hypothetical protein
MEERFYLTKVIWYDGTDAYVSPFILKAVIGEDTITEESRQKLDDYMTGNGEILKIDIQRGALTLDDIIALKGTTDGDLTYYRFSQMYF